jgi:uncharacterized protein (TIGR03435 family)
LETRRILDRPVVHQTELTDRYDFQMKWIPTRPSWRSFRPASSARRRCRTGRLRCDANAARLEARINEAPVDVLVIDKVEKPSENQKLNLSDP